MTDPIIDEQALADAGIYLSFSEECHVCGKTVQYRSGVRDPHPCPENPGLVIEGCGGTRSLAERVEQALDDYEALAAIEPSTHTEEQQ